MRKSKIKILAVLLTVTICCGMSFAFPQTAMAKTRGARRTSSKSTVVFKPSKNGNQNYKKLNKLLSGTAKRTVIIPKGSNIFVNGDINVGSNKTIIANGAKIRVKDRANAIFADPRKKVTNLKVIGGNWETTNNKGTSKSLFVLAFAKNVLLDGITCTANYTGHAMEIIACNNVTVKNCNIYASGTNPAGCREKQVQIDLATKRTAPRIAAFGAKYAQGQTCQNIYLYNNTISGAQATGTSHIDTEGGRFNSKFFKNIVIVGNKITSKNAEGLALFNVINGEIKNNIIESDCTDQAGNASHTVGVYIQCFGQSAEMPDSTMTISGNTIFGNRNGIFMKGYYGSGKTCITPLGTINIDNNTIYCRTGINQAIQSGNGSVKALNISSNKLYQWN